MRQAPFRVEEVRVNRTREATICEAVTGLLLLACWVAALLHPTAKNFLLSGLETVVVAYLLVATYRPRLLFLGQKKPKNLLQLRIEIRFARFLAIMLSILLLFLILWGKNQPWVTGLWTVLVLLIHIYKEAIAYWFKRRK